MLSHGLGMWTGNGAVITHVGVHYTCRRAYIPLEQYHRHMHAKHRAGADILASLENECEQEQSPSEPQQSAARQSVVFNQWHDVAQSDIFNHWSDDA